MFYQKTQILYKLKKSCLIKHKVIKAAFIRANAWVFHLPLISVKSFQLKTNSRIFQISILENNHLRAKAHSDTFNL